MSEPIEKKKVLVISVLGVMLLGVGAFQFTKMSGSEAQAKPAPAQQTPEKPKDEKVDIVETQGVLVSGVYPERDPFHSSVEAELRPNYNPIKPPTKQVRPLPMPGDFRPIGPIELTPFEGGLPYKLIGVIVGKRPAAVFLDENGGQRLVTDNGELDPNTKVLDISIERVALRHGTKTLHLTLGGYEK